MKVILCWPYRLGQNILDQHGDQVAIAADQTWHGFPLGIGYMGAYLDSKGIEVKCYDFSFHTKEKVEEALMREMPDILGITCHTSQRAAVWYMCGYMKSVKSTCTTVVGGYHINSMWRQVMENYSTIVDYCIMGDGALALEALATGHSEEDIPGLVYHTEFGPRHNEQEHLPPDEYPFMRYELFNWQDEEVKPYFKDADNSSLANLNYHNISTGKGCYARCNFCCVHKVWDKPHMKSAQRIYDEMLHYHNTYGPPQGWYKFVDETLPVNSRKMADLCQLLIESPVDFRWECYMRGDVTELSRMRLLRDAGLFCTAIGMESGSQRILDNINKDVTIQGIYDTFQYAHMCDINTFSLLIVGSLGETQETIDETKKVLTDLKPGNIGISYYTIFPGTDLYDYCKGLGIIDDAYWLTDGYPPLYTHEHSFRQLRRWYEDIHGTWAREVVAERPEPYYGPSSPLLPEYSTRDAAESPPLSVGDVQPTQELLGADTSNVVVHTPNIIGDDEIELSGYTLVSDDYLAIPCITSMLDVCDEVVVLLNGADKNLVDIVKGMAPNDSRMIVAEVEYNFLGIDEYHLRNYAISLCRGKYILELDSDEVLFEGQYRLVRDCIRSGKPAHIFKCIQFCGDAYHLQFLRPRSEDLDPVTTSYHGWGTCAKSGYTGWNHVVLYKNDENATYLQSDAFRFGFHCYIKHRVAHSADDIVVHNDIQYCHYSLCQSSDEIYKKFLIYAVSDLTVPDENKVPVRLNTIPIDAELAERLFGRTSGEVVIPNHFKMDPDSPLSNSSDFFVMTYHGEHPLYMRNQAILNRMAITQFNQNGDEEIVSVLDRGVRNSTVGSVNSCSRVYDWREYSMPLDLKRRLHDYGVIITNNYYTFTSEASTINRNTIMIADDPNAFRNNYLDVVHGSIRRIYTLPQYVPALLEMGAPLDKIVYSIQDLAIDRVLAHLMGFAGA